MIHELMYHGTFKEFDSFNPEYFNKDAYCGPGIYLTSEIMDASDFYADMNSNDTQAKIDNLTDTLYNQEEENKSFSELREIAEQEICGEKSYILTCKPKVSKTFKIATYAPKGTYLELWNYNSDDEDAEPEPTEAYYAINSVLNLHGIDFCPEDCEISGIDLLKICQDNCDYDEDTPGEVFQDILKELGYDSILMVDVETFFPMYRGLYSEFNHLIVFSPDNVEIVNREER